MSCLGIGKSADFQYFFIKLFLIYNIDMKRLLLLVLGLMLFTPVYSMEIENQTEGIQTIHQYVYNIDDENNSTIETHEEKSSNKDYIPSELELHGNIIYNESTQTAIELDNTVKKPQINLKTSQMVIPVTNTRIKTTGIYMPDRSALSVASRLTGEEYLIAPVWSNISEQFGNFSYGTIYSSGIDSCQLQSSMNIYTRYDFKYFAITGAVGTNESNVEGTVDERTIQIAPEIKLSKSFAIRDTVQAYVNQDYKKNRISIIYTPQWKKHPDILRFELGLSHTYYSGGKVRSAVEFTTKIRF